MDSKKKTLLIVLAVIAVLVIALYSFFAGNYNKFVKMDVGIKAAWSQVENQLQRRYDLIPNLVETVKGYASHERETLEAVINARAKATSVKLTADDLSDPAAIERMQQVQGQLSSSLSRLLVVAEQYPDLKVNENFRGVRGMLPLGCLPLFR